MKQKTTLIMLMVLGLSLFLVTGIVAQESQGSEGISGGKTISLKEFVDLAVANDTEFERILIDELALKYAKDLGLPADDLVLEVRGQYDFMLSQDREEHDSLVSLSKLFPFTGTSVELGYINAPSITSLAYSSAFTAEISQPIARNAFGKATRLKDKIIGVEVDVARYQIVEAYEDYLAAIITGYYDWYEAYENLKIGESSYNENLRLLDNIKERQKSNIALPLDVNKIHLQVLAKKEKLIELEEEYANALNFAEKAIRYKSEEDLIPREPDLYRKITIAFEKDFEQFKEAGRTYQVLDLLEEKSKLEVDEEADDLLPSINLLVGYIVKGEGLEIEEEDNMVYTGMSMEWPFGDQVNRAEHETSKIALRRTKLSNTGTRFQLHTDIKDIFQLIGREEQLGAIAQEKISLAQSVLEDETENYSFGKVTINDYIQAVNVLDGNRFNQILHDAQRRKYMIEWLRLTDQLVSKKDIYK